MYIHNIITFRPCANKEIWSLPSYQLSLVLAEDTEDGSNGKSLALNTTCSRGGWKSCALLGWFVECGVCCEE